MHDRFRFAQIKVPEFMGPEPLGTRVSDRLQWGKLEKKRFLKNQ